MIRTWPGQTKEEWMEEYRRNQALTSEERENELNNFLDEMRQKEEEERYIKNIQQNNEKNFFEGCDHPNSLENSEATILWIVVMAVATIFRMNWLIWIISTIVWRRYITRHKRKK